MADRQRYTHEDRVAALAALTANAGNIKGTARQVGVPETTLRQWARGTHHPEALRDAGELKFVLADEFERIAWVLLGVVEDKAEDLTAKEAVVAAAVAIDKMRLLRGQATQIVEQNESLPARVDAYTTAFAELADRQGEGGPAGDGAGEPLDPPGSP